MVLVTNLQATLLWVVGFLRDHFFNWIHGYNMFLGSGNSLPAEAWGLFGHHLSSFSEILQSLVGVGLPSA